LSEELDRDVFIGGTSILNPEAFIGDLMSVEGSPTLQSPSPRVLSSPSPPPRADVTHGHSDPSHRIQHSHNRGQDVVPASPEAAKSPQMDPREFEKLMSGLEEL
jgi:hypothetical protein